MTDLTAIKKNIQVEETQYKSSVSESTMQKIGSSLNFTNTYQYDTHSFLFNGAYTLGVGVIGADGVMPVLYNMEIVGITFFNLVSGASGTTQFDISWFNGINSNQGSIFSTKPLINSTSLNYSYGILDVVNSTAIKTGTGITIPTLIKTQFNQGDMITCTLDSSMSGAENAGILIHHRPR